MKSGIVTFAALLCLTASAAAQDAIADFYRGKTVRITVGSAVGGGFDGYARLVGRHFSKHIPGNPTVVVQNIPGAGSNKAASYVALQAPKDGTAIGAIQPGAVLQRLHSDQALPHDPAKFTMLGSAATGVYLCLVRSDAPVKTFAETFANEVVIGTSGEGASLRIMPVMLVNVLGVKLRLIGGYAGSNQILLAIERKEVHGMCGMSWSSISMQRGEWLRNGTLRPIVQEDLRGHPELAGKSKQHGHLLQTCATAHLETREHIHQINMPPVKTTEIIVVAVIPIVIADLPITRCLNTVSHRPVVQYRQIETTAVPGHQVGCIPFNAIKEPANQLGLVRIRVAETPKSKAFSSTQPN